MSFFSSNVRANPCPQTSLSCTPVQWYQHYFRQLATVFQVYNAWWSWSAMMNEDQAKSWWLSENQTKSQHFTELAPASQQQCNVNSLRKWWPCFRKWPGQDFSHALHAHKSLLPIRVSTKPTHQFVCHTISYCWGKVLAWYCRLTGHSCCRDTVLQFTMWRSLDAKLCNQTFCRLRPPPSLPRLLHMQCMQCNVLSSTHCMCWATQLNPSSSSLVRFTRPRDVSVQAAPIRPAAVLVKYWAWATEGKAAAVLVDN